MNKYISYLMFLIFSFITSCETNQIKKITINYVEGFITSPIKTSTEDFMSGFSNSKKNVEIVDENILKNFENIMNSVKYNPELLSPDVRIVIQIEYINHIDTLAINNLRMSLNNTSIEYNKPIVDFLKTKIQSDYLD